MVVSSFGSYHRLVHDDAPTKRAGVIFTPWVMPLALGLGAILLGAGRVACATTTTSKMPLFNFMLRCNTFLFIALNLLNYAPQLN